jgi:hypothetical protein
VIILKAYNIIEFWSGNLKNVRIFDRREAMAG